MLNSKYWKKAYLIEFKSNGVLTDAFTFSVPPESEEFVFPQRKSETKTFGGAVVADYGNDLVQITLSGSTINQELKLIYKSRLGIATMTGEEEIFYLRNLLRKYGSRKNIENKEVYLYSLNGGLIAKKTPKWWKIYVGDLTISRNKDKPFCYNYKFTATGNPEVEKKYNKNLEMLGNAVQTVNNWKTEIEGLVSAITEGADFLEEFGATFLSQVSEIIGTIRSSIDLFNSAIARYVDVINGFITEATGIAVDSVMLGDKVLSTAFRYYPTLGAEVWNTCLNVREAVNELYDFCSNIDDRYFSESAWQNIKEMYDNSVSDIDIADTYSTIAYDCSGSANKMVALTSKSLNDLGVAVNPGGPGKDDEIVVTYGYKVVSTTDAETSWDQIAENYYGNPSYSGIVATYNNLPADKPLVPGQKISIPVLNFSESDFLNEVYNSPDVKDNYGKDILIKNKDFGVHNGDLTLVSGVDNLDQALLNRYSTLVGARIRLEVYGIQASIGDSLNASSALIQASVHQTTVEDPRIESVESIDFQGAGDSLTVAVKYIDKNGSKQNFGGVI